MTIGLLTNALSSFGTFITSVYIFQKALNYSSPAPIKVVSILWCLAWALFDACNPPWISLLMLRTIFCVATILLLWKLTKVKFDTVLSAYLLSFGASYSLAFIAAIPIGLIFAPFLGAGLADDVLIDINDPIYLLFYFLIAALQFLIAYRFFKIRRFKRGFPFLFGRVAVIAALIVAGITLAIFTLVVSQRDTYGTYPIVLPLIASAVIAGAGIVMWIRMSIRVMQKKWAKEDNEVLYQKRIVELERELQLQKDVNENFRMANHSIRHRIASWEQNIARVLEAGISGELSIALSDIRKLLAEYEADVSRVKSDTFLPSTNVKALDDLFSLFAERFKDNGIRFKLKVMGSIVYMTENTIKQGKLETMIGDHLEDALIAVKASESSMRSVMVAIGEVGDYYEFTVFDSGIPFEIDTLVKLGTERVTTHADTGGSGVGFMKTLETMRECGASLIIRENKGGVFSKSITIRFNGENRYIIETYRPDDFPESDRYTVIGYN